MDELITRLLKPHLGHTLSPWPSPVYRTLDQLAQTERLEPEALLWRLLTAPDEEKIAVLISSATITHTAFFRHAEQFDYLRVQLPRIAARRGGVVRVWSAGCATGEEPYSIAMCGQDAGVDVRILATDVDAESLRRARAGRYDVRRAAGLVGCDPVHGWLAPESLKQSIRFEQSSLVGPDPALSLGPFDIVFCRNVLVYFPQEAASRIIDMLLRSLHPSGSLVVAPVEGVMRVPRERPEKAPLGWFAAQAAPAPTLTVRSLPGLATRRATPPPPRHATPVARSLGEQPLFRAPAPRRAPSPSRAPARTPAPTTSTSSTTASLPAPALEALEAAAQRLGAGDRDGAEELLRDLLDQDPENAEAWFLLGETLLQREQRVQARIAFDKAARCAENAAAVEAETLARAARRRSAMCV